MSNQSDEHEPRKLDFPQVTEEINEDESDDQADELSLDQLAQAYADVIKDRETADESAVLIETDDRDTNDSDLSKVGELDLLEPSNNDLSSATETVNSESERPVVEQKPSRTEKDPALEDEEDDAGCSISPETILEAILFVGCPLDEKLTSRKIASVMRDVSPKEVTSLYKVLNAKYKTENAPYHIVSESGNLRLVLHENDAELQMVRDQFYGEIRHAKLSQGAIDVLAVVAYNQPVTREDIEKVRLKPSGSYLNQMIRRELLQVETNDDAPKQRFYRTTDRFLELFSLESLNDLPQTNAVSDMEELAD